MPFMRKKYLRLLTGFLAFAYLAVIALGAWRVYRQAADTAVRAEQEFAGLVDRFSAAAVLGFMKEPFQEAVRDSLESADLIAAVIITGPSGPEYAVERTSGFLTGSGVDTGFARAFRLADRNLFAPLAVPGVRNAAAKAVFYRFDLAELFKILRDSLILLIAALIPAIILFFVDRSDADADSGEADDGRAERGDSAPDPRASVYGSAGYRATSPAASLDNLPELAPEARETFIPEIPELIRPETGDGSALADAETGALAESVPERSNETSGSPAAPSAAQPAAESSESPAPPVAAFVPPGQAIAGTAAVPKAADPDEGDSAGPVGLFSPRSGLGWEAYTDERLTAEIHRSASFEQDLVFVMAELVGDPSVVASSYRTFAESLRRSFTFQDMLFEVGEAGAAAILPNVDLDHGMRMVDEFRSKLRKQLYEAGVEIDRVDVRLGLSSRTGRLLDAERLRLEARRAMEKAEEDMASPIVAFKPDAEKYRAFIAAQAAEL
jgi:hypothetical protein